MTVDTEFMRERTYYPELCVVQLGGERENAVIDTPRPPGWTSRRWVRLLRDDML